MKLKDNFNSMTGRLSLRVIDQDGNVILNDQGNNLIVENGYSAVAEAIGGVDGATIAKIGIGTNGTLPAGTDLALTNMFTVDVDSIEYPHPAVVRFNFTIPYNDANGMVIAEFGLITKDGRLFARRVREKITKTMFLMIIGTWEITV